MRRQSDIVVAGELYVDLILSGLSAWPEAGREIFAEEFRREIGGGAAIAACGLAKLGSRVALLGVVGNDWGRWVTQGLRQRNVDTELVQFDAEEPTAFTVVATTPHDRAFLSYYGANRSFERFLMKAAEGAQFSGVRHVHLAFAPSRDRAAQLFEQLHAQGCTLSLDLGWREDWILDRSAVTALRHVDIFFPNEIEAQHLTGEDSPGEILRGFHSAGVKRVALKLGERGAALLWDGEITSVDPHSVVPIDTTGAGDCFDAGFLHAWLRGEAPRACLCIANVCGALSTTAYGGIAGFPTPEQLLHEMKKANVCAK